jgi:hypothetical protein
MRMPAYALIDPRGKDRACRLASSRRWLQAKPMWHEPYLETCCRAALHRMVLSGQLGRPGGLKDGPCLTRLCTLGLAEILRDGRYTPTAAGRVRHAIEVLRKPAK